MKPRHLILPALLALCASAHAAISITSPTQNYTQDFNSLTSSGTWTNDTTINGWYSDKTAFTTTTGGATSTGSLYSYGSSGTPADRALGGLANTTNGVSIGLRLVNNTGASLGATQIAFNVEQWRAAAGANSPVAFSYQIFNAGAGSLAAAGYTSVAALSTIPGVMENSPGSGTDGAIDGNSNFTPLSSTVSGLNWSAGQELWLKWDISKVSGGNIHEGIDEFSFTVVPEPSTFLLGALGALALLRRRRN